MIQVTSTSKPPNFCGECKQLMLVKGVEEFSEIMKLGKFSSSLSSLLHYYVLRVLLLLQNVSMVKNNSFK